MSNLSTAEGRGGFQEHEERRGGGGKIWISILLNIKANYVDSAIKGRGLAESGQFFDYHFVMDDR